VARAHRRWCSNVGGRAAGCAAVAAAARSRALLELVPQQQTLRDRCRPFWPRVTGATRILLVGTVSAGAINRGCRASSRSNLAVAARPKHHAQPADGRSAQSGRPSGDGLFLSLALSDSASVSENQRPRPRLREIERLGAVHVADLTWSVFEGVKWQAELLLSTQLQATSCSSPLRGTALSQASAGVSSN